MSNTFEALCLTCRKITLEDFDCEMHIGAYAGEKNAPQAVRVTVSVWIPRDLTSSDRLEDVYDYTVLAETVERVCRGASFDLQETFGDALARKLLTDSRVQAVRIKTAKLKACAAAKAVSVDTFHLNPNAQPSVFK